MTIRKSHTILMYHQINDVPPPSTPFRGLVVSPKSFKQQMSWLSRIGYQGLSLREMEPYIRGEKTGKVVGITFDDGFFNVFINALPILKNYGFTATCFFVSGQIGGFNLWDEALGVPYAACMSKQEILEWVEAGNEVGAHTVDHVRLSQVEPSDAINQIRKSRIQLEDVTGKRVESFAYPYGDVNQHIRDITEQCGFRLATTTRRAQATASDDPLLLPRRNIRHCDSWVATLRKTIFG